MRKYLNAFGPIIVGLALVLGFALIANADGNDGIIEGNWPEGVDVWRVDGHIFVRDEVSGELVWWCEGWCDGNSGCPIPSITTTPGPTQTPGGPTATPTPPVDLTETPGPEPTEKEPCNRGVGNSGNDCDPGNSSGQGQGEGRPAGEDRDENDTGPGNSGGNGNQNDRGKND